MWRGFRPSTRLCRPPASDWPQLMPSTAGTASWYVRSTAPASLQAVPDAPTCAPPPPAADDTLYILRSSATHVPTEASLPADEGSPSDRCLFLIPHTALLAGTLRRPPRRTRRLSVGGCDPFCRSGYPSCYNFEVVCPAGQVQAPDSRSISKSSLGKRLLSGRRGSLAISVRPASANA